MLYPDFSEKILGLQEVMIKKVEEIDGKLFIYIEKERKPTPAPAAENKQTMCTTIVCSQLRMRHALGDLRCFFSTSGDIGVCIAANGFMKRFPSFPAITA